MGYELGPCMILVYNLHTATASVNSATGISESDTTIPYDGASGTFPDRGVIKIDDELILYMARTDTEFKNCVRGFKGTTAASHADDASITLEYSDLGKTQGGVTLTVSETSVQLRTDQDGEVPVDEIITGTPVTVTLNLADITLDNFAFVHKSTKQTSGDKAKVEVYPNVGKSLLNDASYKVLIVPYAGAAPSNDVNRMIVIPKAGVRSAEELVFNISDQRVIRCELTGYPDDAGRVLIFGDEDI